ncbi:wax ester synthase/diacylglycerol acyltransferase 11-like [Malania oleifera]|uniref:wax ester synthase/diacylglycerol acyltransferase 11-like n=1 Tax=Malania oleifera TaxID=397392 RepID=UPI0025AE5DC4|nr:wax ester synthase/diacylglycerol acyltransferase 11-like [Malania oleifera]
MDTVEGFMSTKQGRLKPVRTKRDEYGEGMQANTEEEQKLSPVARLFHEPSCNLYIIAIMGLKTRINPDIIKDQLQHTLLKHPRFSSLQVADEKNGKKMRWVQTEVDLEQHVIIPDIDLEMNSPDKFVEDYISSLSKTPIDSSKPLWDLHLLNIKTSDAEATGVFRIHHSLGDGISLMSLLLACTRKISDPEAAPTLPVKKKLDSNNFRGFWSTLRLYWNTMVDFLLFLATVLFLKDTKTPLSRSAEIQPTSRRFVHRTVSLDDVKLVKNAMGATINDVALGIIQAGLSRYLNRRYGEEKNYKGTTEKQNNLPKNIRFRAPLFINLRPVVGISALADMMERGSKVKWGNAIGYVLLPFTIALRDDPLDYVLEAKATVDRKKHSLEAMCTFPFADLIIKFLGVKAGSVLTYRVPSHTTIGFSNMIGPQEEIAFRGHPISFIAPSCYGQPNALMIHVQSYVNKMTFVLSVDESIIPDPHQLCNDLEESLKLIKGAILPTRSADESGCMTGASMSSASKLSSNRNDVDGVLGESYGVLKPKGWEDEGTSPAYNLLLDDSAVSTPVEHAYGADEPNMYSLYTIGGSTNNSLKLLREPLSSCGACPLCTEAARSPHVRG